MIVETCANHLSAVDCDCGKRDFEPHGHSGASASVPVHIETSKGGTFVTGMAKHVSNALAQQPNRLRIISWNLQNFTGDTRMGRSSGPIGSDGNAARARFVGALTRALAADLLLVMETGSDVASALEAIRRSAGDEYRPFVSPHTHGTPDAARQHTIQVAHPWARDALRLRQLTPVFDVTPGTGRAWSVGTATALLAKAYSTADWQCRAMTDPMRSVLIDIHAQPLPDESVPDVLPANLEELAKCLHRLDAYRGHARSVRAARAVYLADVLEIMLLHRATGGGGGDPRFAEMVLRRGYLDRLAASAFLLLAHESLTLGLEEGQLVHEIDDADLIYQALRHFNCVNFHFETYGALFRGSAEQCEKMFGLEGNWSVARFNHRGQLLATQRPGSSFNWRTAWRGAVPLPGGKWVEVLLFHTRFTPSGKALEDESEETNVARTLAMRAQSVATVANFVVNDDTWGVPIAYLGDFNLPMTEPRPVLRTFSVNMEALGFTRYPANCPLTTLRKEWNLASDGDGFYSEAYDGAYVSGLPRTHAACQVLDIAAMASLLPVDVIDLLQPFVARFYANQVRKLCNRLANRRAAFADRPPRGPAGRAFVKLLDAARAKPALALLLGDDSAFNKLKGMIWARAERFANRSLNTDGDLTGDPIAALWDEIQSLPGEPGWNEMGSAPQRRFTDLAKKLREFGQVLRNLDTMPLVRFAVGYELCVSDHLPLLLELDLDGPVSGSIGGPSRTSSPSHGSLGDPSSGPAPSYPSSADEFLQQQMRSDDDRMRFAAELGRIGKREGRATSVENDCLLHTLRQLEAGRELDADGADLPGLRQELALAPSTMIAIGANPVLGHLRHNGICVHLYMLELDGSLTGPIVLGAPPESARATWSILHYGAHYVPLW